jgi:hypothetical protein
LDRLRAVQGIVALKGKYAAVRIEAACDRALRFGDPSCRRVRSILTAGTDLEPAEKVVQLRLVSFEFARGASEFFTEEESCWNNMVAVSGPNGRNLGRCSEEEVEC